MGKFSRVLIILTILSTPLTSLRGESLLSSNPYGDVNDNFTYIEDLLLKSSRYTQPDEDDPALIDRYHDDFILNYSPAQLTGMGFVKSLEDTHTTVWLEKDSFSVIIIDKDNGGYQYSSRAEFQGIKGVQDATVPNRRKMNSGLWIDYVNKNNIKSSGIITNSLHDIAEATYKTADFDNLTSIYTTNEYKRTMVDPKIISMSNKEVVIEINIKKLSFKFNVILTLSNGKLKAKIARETIEENDEKYLLLGIYLFPFLGSVREDNFPGYLVIPDGLGALIRTNKFYGTYLQSGFFGSDRGYQRYSQANLSLPIFGLIHEAGYAGFMGNILEGAEHTTFIAQLYSEANLWHRATTRYNLRTVFQHIINRAGAYYEDVLPGFVDSDFEIEFSCLKGDDASYVGVGKTYRDYLVNTGVLSSKEKVIDEKIPLKLTYLLNELEPAFLGNRRLHMTSIDKLDEMYEAFKDEGISNQSMSLYGWSKDGYGNTNPYRMAVYEENKLKKFLDKSIIDDQNEVYLNNNYVVSTNLTRRINPDQEAARDLSRLRISNQNRDDLSRVKQFYWLKPETSVKLARQDSPKVSKLGASGVELEDMQSLFSYYDGDVYLRSHSKTLYQEVAASFEKTSLNAPKAYLFKAMDEYLNMPVNNAQFDYYTDLVPLVPIVLKGLVSYYTPFLNFNALGIDRLLNMVDFGINPSFLLTHQDSSLLRYTESRHLYSTAYHDFKDEVVDVYNYLNEALKYVVNAQIMKRETLSVGFQKVSYSNGVIIYINYTNSVKSDGMIHVSAHNYEVVR